MKKFFKNILPVLNISCIVVSFAFNIYYLPRLNFAFALLLGFVDILCIIIYIITLVIYYFSEKDYWVFLRFRVISITLIILHSALFVLGIHHKIGDYFFVFINQNRMDEIVKTAKKYDNVIFIDSDGNFRRSFVKNDSLGLDDTYRASGMKFEDYRIIVKNLNSLENSDIYIKDSYYFILTSGFLDGIGFAYSENRIRPEKYANSKITRWDHVTGNWYSWYCD